MDNYSMGFITNTERYNQIIDIWTHVNSRLTDVLMKQMTEAQQGFNSVFMMLDSGARGSKDQIRQLAGMRGLMAKPQKAGAEGGQIIENPILANFKEGLSVLEYFISTHGARKGLADTALKTADAGYLTRRLVDVAHDVIITEEDCGTLRGLVCTEIKNNDEVVASLGERILGRVSVHDIVDPLTGEVIVTAGRGNQRRRCRPHRRIAYRERRDTFSPNLRVKERCLRQMLWPQPRQQPPCSDRRGCRRHRRPVNRRARYTADTPYIPRRWCRFEYRSRIVGNITL